MTPGWKAVRAQSVVYGAAAPPPSHKGWGKTKPPNVGGWAMNPERPCRPLNLKGVMLFFLFLFISFCFFCHYVIFIAMARRQKCQASAVQQKALRWRRSGRQPPHSLDLLIFIFLFFFFFFNVQANMIWVRKYKCQAFPHEDGGDWGPLGLMLGSFPSCPLRLYLSDFLIRTTQQGGASPPSPGGVKWGSNRIVMEEFGWLRFYF